MNAWVHEKWVDESMSDWSTNSMYLSQSFPVDLEVEYIYNYIVKKSFPRNSLHHSDWNLCAGISLNPNDQSVQKKT